MGLALAASAVHAAPEKFVVDAAHTFPSFEVSHLGISTTRGRFERTTGGMVLDEDARAGSMDIEIDATRVSTGNPVVDGWLTSETFFDVERHPRIVFRSRNFVPGRERPFRAEGELTLLGLTRPVVLSVERFGCTVRPATTHKTCGADIATTISRAAFGMTGYAAIIGDEVRLEIQFEAVAEEAAPPAR
jgi:polyisoprenoid-binding protein YceI